MRNWNRHFVLAIPLAISCLGAGAQEAPPVAAPQAEKPAVAATQPPGRSAAKAPTRPDRRPPTYSRNAVEVRRAYSDIARKSLDATLRVFNGKDRAALGTVVGPEGFVLTKASEVHGEIECELPDGSKMPAKIIGIVQEHDLALLKLDISKAAGQLTFVSLYDGDTPPVGTLLTSPNPDIEPGAVGVLSAAPRLVPKQRGRMGIKLAEGLDGPARIENVTPNGPAMRAKIASGDVIAAVQSVEVKSVAELHSQMEKYEPGDTIKLNVRRGDQSLDFTLTLGGEAIFAEAAGGRPNREEFQNRLGGDLSRRRVGFKSVIQHDTVLIPTDCGGPLVDLDGNVIGINIARAGRVNSYAVPSSAIRALLPEMIAGKFAPRSDVDQQLQRLAQVEDDLLKKIGALRNVLSGEPDEDEPEDKKPVEAILPDDEKMKIETQIGELESQLSKVRADLLQLETKKSGAAEPSPTSTSK